MCFLLFCVSYFTLSSMLLRFCSLSAYPLGIAFQNIGCGLGHTVSSNLKTKQICLLGIERKLWVLQHFHISTLSYFWRRFPFFDFAPLESCISRGHKLVRHGFQKMKFLVWNLSVLGNKLLSGLPLHIPATQVKRPRKLQLKCAYLDKWMALSIPCLWAMHSHISALDLVNIIPSSQWNSGQINALFVSDGRHNGSYHLDGSLNENTENKMI